MLNHYFDKCYCIHINRAKARYKMITDFYKDYGIYNDITITHFPTLIINKEIGDMLKSIHSTHYDKMKINYGNVFSCSYNFLQVITSAYEQGFEHILIMEDDCIFNVSPANLENILDVMPKGYDIIKFAWTLSGGYGREWVDNLFKQERLYNSKFLTVTPDCRLNWNGCFALSRNGMRYYINYMNNRFVAADVPFCELPVNFNLNYYITTKNIIRNLDCDSTI